MIKQVLKMGSPSLLEKSLPIAKEEFGSAELLRLIEDLVDTHNDVLYGNMSTALAQALIGNADSFLYYSYLPGRRDPITIHHLPGIHVDVSRI